MMNATATEIFKIDGKTFSFDLRTLTKKYYTPKQAAEYLNVAPNTVRKWVEDFEKLNIFEFEKTENKAVAITPKQMKVFYYLSKIREVHDREPLVFSIDRLYEFFTWLPPKTKKETPIPSETTETKKLKWNINKEQQTTINFKNKAQFQDSLLTFFENREDEMVRVINQKIQETEKNILDMAEELVEKIFQKNENKIETIQVGLKEEISSLFKFVSEQAENNRQKSIEEITNIHPLIQDLISDIKLNHQTTETNFKTLDLRTENIPDMLNHIYAAIQKGNENTKLLLERIEKLETNTNQNFFQKLFQKSNQKKELPTKPKAKLNIDFQKVLPVLKDLFLFLIKIPKYFWIIFIFIFGGLATLFEPKEGYKPVVRHKKRY